MNATDRMLAETGIGVELLKWASVVEPERFAAWRAARAGEDLPAFQRECALMRTAYSSRVRFVVWTGSALGVPVAIASKPTPSPALFEDYPEPLPVLDAAELAVMVDAERKQPGEALRLARLALDMKQQFPAARLSATEGTDGR